MHGWSYSSLGYYLTICFDNCYYFLTDLLFFRTFTQVSVQWQDTDSMREELDDLQVCEF